MLTPSSSTSKSGARSVMEPIDTSCPILAPSARSHQVYMDEPLSKYTGAASTSRSASHQRK